MSLKDVKPGRYTAKVKDWGLEEVEQLDGAIKAVVIFDFETGEDEWETIKWDGFIQKRDGGINQKTVDSLKVCGLSGTFVDLVEGGPGLDTSKDIEITIEHDGQYHKVEWINEPGGGQYTANKEAGSDLVKRLKGLSLEAGLSKSKTASKKKTTTKVKNHAPGAEDSGVDEDEEIPF